MIGEDGKQIGIVTREEALRAAREEGLDLVEVAPNADPPVCRIMDYGKFLYKRTKRAREARKARKGGEVKEIRLRPKTDEHAIAFKLRDARRFLNDKCKVKVRVRFYGREITHPEIGRELLERIISALEDISEVEQPPSMVGRSMLMILSPRKK